jgi:hypothetical protein
MYRRIENDPKLKGAVKLIGIGAGNTPLEVGYFQNKYAIAFPLFADSDFSIHKKIGEVRTPYFIGIRIKGDGSHKIYCAMLGGAGSADALMQRLLKDAGLDQK